MAFVLALLAVGQVCEGVYSARLWFRNVTKGFEGPGAVYAEPGDRVAIRFAYSTTDPVIERWTILQMTLSLDGIAIISEAEANTFRQQASAAFTPMGHFPVRIFWQPDDGPMHDNGIDPGDTSKQWLADRGLYFVVGVSGVASSSWSFNKTLYTFTVQPQGVGQVLDWMLDGYDSPTGMSTRMMDYVPQTVDVTDNYLMVVPGIGTVSGKVVLEQWLPPAQGVVVQYWLLDGSQVVTQGSTTLGAGGVYQIVLPHVGTYRLRVKASRWLSALSAPLVLSSSGVAEADFVLLNGDADGDNAVTLADVSSVLMRFAAGGSPPEDLDGSGLVDLPDLSIALVNFGHQGQ